MSSDTTAMAGASFGNPPSPLSSPLIALLGETIIIANTQVESQFATQKITKQGHNIIMWLHLFLLN